MSVVAEPILTAGMLQFIQFRRLLHQFNTDCFKLMRSREMRAITRQPGATLRQVAQICCIDPNPFVGLIGVRGCHFDFELAFDLATLSR